MCRDVKKKEEENAEKLTNGGNDSAQKGAAESLLSFSTSLSLTPSTSQSSSTAASPTTHPSPTPVCDPAIVSSSPSPLSYYLPKASPSPPSLTSAVSRYLKCVLLCGTLMRLSVDLVAWRHLL